MYHGILSVNRESLNVRSLLRFSHVPTRATVQTTEDDPQGEGAGVVVAKQQLVTIRNSTFANNTVGKKVSKRATATLLPASDYPTMVS